MSYARYKSMRKAGMLPSPKKVAVVVSKKKQNELQKASKAYVKSAITRSLNKNIDAFYVDGFTLTASTTQGFYDVSAALHTAVGIRGIHCDNRSFRYKGVVNVADSINHLRMIIFKWHPDTATALPTSNLVIRNDGSASAPWGLPHYEKRKQFTILYDRLFQTQTQATGSVDPVTINFDIRLSSKKLGMTQYNQSTSSGTNHIFILYVSDSLASGHPSIYGNLFMSYVADE